MKRWHEFLITAVIVLVLLLLSFELLKLPEVYFAYSDERLNGVQSINSYDIDNEIKSMTMAQKMEIFEEDDLLMMEEGPLICNGELYENLVDKSFREYLSMFYPEGDVEYIINPIRSVWYATPYRSVAYNVIKVKENEIYSMKIGVLELNNNMYDGFYFSLGVIFDLETYDIYAVSLQSQDYFDLFNRLWINDDAGLKLKEYYEQDILHEKLFSNIVFDTFIVFPWDHEITQKKLLQTVIKDMMTTDMQQMDTQKIIDDNYPEIGY